MSYSLKRLIEQVYQGLRVAVPRAQDFDAHKEQGGRRHAEFLQHERLNILRVHRTGR